MNSTEEARDYTITTHADLSETYVNAMGAVVATICLDGDWITRRYFDLDNWDETSFMWKSDAQQLARQHAETIGATCCWHCGSDHEPGKACWWPAETMS